MQILFVGECSSLSAQEMVYRRNAMQHLRWVGQMSLWCLWRMTNENWRSASHRNTICSWLLFLCGWHVTCDARIPRLLQGNMLRVQLCATHGLRGCCWMCAIFIFVINNGCWDWNEWCVTKRWPLVNFIMYGYLICSYWIKCCCWKHWKISIRFKKLITFSH